jgi:hypothetical protein
MQVREQYEEAVVERDESIRSLSGTDSLLPNRKSLPDAILLEERQL